ncbi:glycosyltransferase family 4 protein [Domibacillus sp. DTU_2020_1001157_1_SI_ALB_TIR_016]|uniref:glycosyltransferase family 4 protein n=1 Tax=Domibacillus sp. DTU_2020_1001157_1_SI_ALB_TIR_016 TaxID=3077789 RepID=UPI0028EAA045|nr:glycosyltransferase family 4 protein [Domibacillus sp. DTU_2020_1001157_1_SI_ALB_TIR_016]WNS81184.1 glycosyltransferase family 4 protein [Domibacillus sp. DTU_2020_1001157_1_SI_ALB_TIR_016]
MDKKMIYVLNHYSSKSVQHFYHVLNLLITMADKGVKIALIIEKCDDIPSINHKNIEVICQKEKNKFKRVIELYTILTNLIKNGYKKIYVRITLNSAIISIISSRLHGAETFYWHSGTTHEVDMDQNFFKKLKWLLLSYSKFWFVKKSVSYFVTGPESMIDYYVNELKIKREKMLLLYNDIDIKRFNTPSVEEKQKIKERLGFNSSEKIILMVHRLSPVRKTDLYIPYIMEDESLTDHNATLVIIGEGPEKANLEYLIKKSPANNRIKLLGSKPNREVQEYYRAADIFINPSYTEGFPRVVIEAMACGLPIVATDAGGTNDIFENLQKQYVVPKKDRKMFRDKLSTLMGDEAKLAELSKENLRTVQKYSTEAVSDMYIERIF